MFYHLIRALLTRLSFKYLNCPPHLLEAFSIYLCCILVEVLLGRFVQISIIEKKPDRGQVSGDARSQCFLAC